jgi:hypothetical protein
MAIIPLEKNKMEINNKLSALTGRSVSEEKNRNS